MSTWSPAASSCDAPAVELELITGGRHDDITGSVGRRTSGRRLAVGDSRIEVFAAPAGRGRMLRVTGTGARDADDGVRARC